MDGKKRTDADENTRLLDDDHSGMFKVGSSSESGSNVSSEDTIVFDTKMMKTSTLAEDLAATWGGRRSAPDSGRLRRAQSWSGGPPDDVSSEIRILRER